MRCRHDSTRKDFVSAKAWLQTYGVSILTILRGHSVGEWNGVNF